MLQVWDIIRPLAPVNPHRKFIFYVDAKAELGNKKATIDTQIISKSSLKKKKKEQCKYDTPSNLKESITGRSSLRVWKLHHSFDIYPWKTIQRTKAN